MFPPFQRPFLLNYSPCHSTLTMSAGARGCCHIMTIICTIIVQMLLTDSDINSREKSRLNICYLRLVSRNSNWSNVKIINYNKNIFELYDGCVSGVVCVTGTGMRCYLIDTFSDSWVAFCLLLFRVTCTHILPFKVALDASE